MEIVDRLSGRHQRDQYLSALLNGSPDVDSQLTEAVRVIVMLAAISAHEDFISSGVEVSNCPVVVWQTFGRRSSLSAEMFFHERLNRAPDASISGDSKVRNSSYCYTFLRCVVCLSVRLSSVTLCRSVQKCSFTSVSTVRPMPRSSETARSEMLPVVST